MNRYPAPSVPLWVVMAAGFVLLVLSFPMCLGRCDNGRALQNAERFAESAGLQVVTIADRDTDGDGYASVTFRDADGEMFGGQCGTGYGFAWIMGTDSCKLDTGKVWGSRGTSP